MKCRSFQETPFSVRKTLCDCCKEEIEDQEINFILDIKAGREILNGKDEWTLCFACQYEMILFLTEQCKYHRLANIELAMQKLKL
jgi:hypothetical protein